ncbi:MAG: YCF48-related protein [Planctomycetota bacterium]
MRVTPPSVRPLRWKRCFTPSVLPSVGLAPEQSSTGRYKQQSFRLLGCKLLALIALVFSLMAARPTWAGMPIKQQSHMTREMLDDARLNDMFFLNSDLGWAVGDRGVILHTEDGGRHWRTQQVSTAAQLESVHFIDDERGWVVGGRVHSYTRRTSCVIARTQDGGATWKIVSDMTLPGLEYVQFHDAQHGWAVGKSSALYPAGVFRTSDGGRSWTTLPSSILGTWTSGHFRNPKHGIVAGHDGNLAVVRGPRISPSRTPDLGRRPLRALRMQDERNGWLVGDGGLVMQTADAGLTWQNPAGELPAGIKAHCDFHALSVLENHVWIAGSPGTVVLHSADAGQTWDVFRTDQQVPLHAISFVDPNRGWAAGALGTILATRDGGHTWRQQRSGGTRIALLGVFGEPDRMPLELFAKFSGDQGYLAFAEILARRDVEVPSAEEAPLEAQAHAAVTAVGGCGARQAWHFPLRQKGLRLGPDKLIETWNRAHDGQGTEAMEEYMVRGIRQWQPEVIITEAASPHDEPGLPQLINQLVLSAVSGAADPTSFPDHAALLDLAPWTVKKVFCVSKNRDQADVRLASTQLSTRLGRSVAEHAASGYAMLRSQYQSSPVTIGFQLLHDRVPQSAGRTDIFSGIHLPPGGEARRRAGQGATADLKSLTRAAEKRRNMERVFEMTSGASSQAAAWLGQVEDLTEQLPPLSAGQVLFQLGQRYQKAGRLELAAQTLEQLVEQHRQHPLAEKALAWLVQYYASGEIAWQLQSGTRFNARIAKTSVVEADDIRSVRQADHQQRPTKQNSDPPARPVSPPTPAQNTAPTQEPSTSLGMVQTQLDGERRETTAGSQFDMTQRSKTALKYAKRIQQQHPALFAEPRLQFPMAVAYRAQGLPADAERFYHRLSALPVHSHWNRGAQAELWLSHGRGVAPKPTYICRKGTTRPRLDGQLDDAIWQQAEPLELTSAHHEDGQWPAAAMLAHDDQFLFLAATCRKTDPCNYPSSSRPRPRDPDLADQDRVELFIDVDRDYTSFYRLTVDHRGWTGEACMGNQDWNPTWYVASKTTSRDWTIEAAIPWQQLVPHPPRGNDAWAIGFHRIAPGIGIQSFTKPAAVHPRGEAFALLIFQ